MAAGLALLGAIDDLVKLRTQRPGISARGKLAGQLLVAGAAATVLYFDHATLPDGLVLPPPWNVTSVSLGIWFVPLAVLVMVGSSNAVNLTDGLDGLAGGCMLFAAAAMLLVTYAAGHAQWAAYLNVPHVAGCGEQAVLAAGMIGAVVGFLWFNCHPAQVFMGDTGSLPLGGLLGYMAVVARQELLLVLIGGVFVAEAASVILQVGWYKWRRQRIFLCARCTIISSFAAGRKTRSWSAFGSPPRCALCWARRVSGSTSSEKPPGRNVELMATAAHDVR